MKARCKKIAAATLVFTMLLSLFAFDSIAYDFEECYHCNKTGEFHCQKCGNTGEVVCDGCGGRGRFECPGEEDKGKCDNGYYVCPSCGGDGLSRPIPEDGEAGPCGQCGGTGKIECWHCHGAGILVCDRCGGAGKNECTDGNCVQARKINYKCPYCKGTGYLGDGPDFPQEYNDGVHNVPKEGDHIITDHASWTGYYYGTGETDEDKQQQGGEGNNNDDEARDPATGRDYVWFIDVGEGVWDIEGQHIAVERNGNAVSGTIDVKYNEPFTVSGLTDRNTHVYLVADGFKTELTELNGDHEYSVANRSPKTPKVPFNVSMSVEYIEGSAPAGPEGGGDPGLIRRKIDFGDGVWDNNGSPVTAWIGDETAAGVIEVEAGTAIRLEGFDREWMTVYLRAEDGFSVTLMPSDVGDFSIDRYEQTESVLAEDVLRFDVDIIKKELTAEETDNRAVDHIIMPKADEGERRVYADIDIGLMNGDEQKYFTGLSDGELANVKEKIQTALGSVKVGGSDRKTDALFKKLAGTNGFDSAEDGRFFAVSFEGERDVGFPFRVTVTLEPGELDGGKELYVYSLREDGSIKPVGKADYVTYEDGSVESVWFITNGFSEFFTAAKELKLDAADDPAVSYTADGIADDSQKETESGKLFPAAVIVTAVCAAAAVTVVIVLIVRKKRK